MTTLTFYATGNQIATYTGLTSKGNANGVQVQISGAQPLGSETDVFRIVVRQVNPGQTDFTNGQFVDIYAYPDTTQPPVPLYSSLNPQHDQFQGRASSESHQIFTQPDRIILDVNGFPTLPDFRYGPGLNPPRAGQLDFDAFPATPPAVPCFVAGTLIDTPTGPLPIEVLRPGDLVTTLDHGPLPLRWTASRTVPGTGDFAPVLIHEGALGNHRDLRVSPQHRMQIDDWRATLWFGQPQVLVAAIHLINDRDILRAPQASVTYVHMLFDHHTVVLAEGIAAESLHLGQTALASLPRAARAEVLALFPEMAAQATAHPCLRGWEGRLIA